MTAFSFSPMTRLLRSGPAITRSMASSMAAMPICFSPRRAAGQHVEDDVRAEGLALGVHVEDRLAALEVGPVDDDLAVEAARPQQRRIEDVGPVGGGDDDHARLD